MKIPVPIFSKLLLWFFLIMAVGVALVLFTFKPPIFSGGELSLETLMNDKLFDAGMRISDDLRGSNEDEWGSVLQRYSNAYRVNFAIYSEDGRFLAGKPDELPSEVIEKIKESAKRRPPFFHKFESPDQAPPHPRGEMEPPPDDEPPRMRGGPGGEIGKPPRMGPKNPRAESAFLARAGRPPLYWGGVPLPIFLEGRRHPKFARLIASSSSPTGHGLFIDPTPWLILIFMTLIIVVMWVPFVRHITKPLKEILLATDQIAKGRFDIKLDDKRRDEIGALAASINQMSSQLDTLVKGQKRFLADVAHELASPIARIQLALGIFENALKEEDLPKLKDLQDEVRQLTDLVNELLSFSRAENAPGRIKLSKTNVNEAVLKAVGREDKAGCNILINAPDDITALADPELLTRAVSNILRNAVRYAGDAGPIEIRASKSDSKITIEVRDCGTGVKPEALPHLFEPFYRVDASRNRESGGVGLGLAIVKTCVTACKGSVSAMNLEPKGFAVVITFGE